LRAPSGDRTRPTSDRVREAIFDVLGSVLAPEGWDRCTVVDLFAGSGAIGIEALSRGAASAVFVDRDRAAVAAVRGNLASLGIPAVRATVVQAEAAGWLAGIGSGRSFDVAVCDPPYAFDGWDGVWDHLHARIAVVESSRDVAIPAPWAVIRRKRYGSTLVTVATSSSGTETGGSTAGNTQRGVD